MNNFNKNSIKYFIYILSCGKNLPYLPREIREIIWDKYFTYPIINCMICNKILLNFNVYILDSNYIESNDEDICWPCNYNQDIMF